MKGRILAMAAIAAIALAGCGGSGSGPAGGFPGAVTRDQEPNFSPDSLLLASQSSSDVWIPFAYAASIDADLLRIRAAYPVLATLHARPRSEPRTLLVTLKAGAPFADAWRAGTLTTGDAKFDALLTDYNAVSVRSLSGDTFVVTFAQWLNTTRLATAVKAASGQVSAAGENFTVGDGNQIYRSVSGGARGYAFVKGWGDCSAGCIFKHRWNVTVSADGALSMTESGSPLP